MRMKQGRSINMVKSDKKDVQGKKSLPDRTSQSIAVLGAVSTSTNCPIHICSIVSEKR